MFGSTIYVCLFKFAWDMLEISFSDNYSCDKLGHDSQNVHLQLEAATVSLKRDKKRKRTSVTHSSLLHFIHKIFPALYIKSFASIISSGNCQFCLINTALIIM